MENKATILYVTDPLCGWCYGFSPVMVRMHEEHPEYNYRVTPGGMITGSRVQPVSAMADYILGAYKRVEEYTGVTFGEPYLDMLRDGKEISNSEPPCRALHLFADMQPHNAIPFAHALQYKIFKKGKSWNSDATYRELAQQFGIEADAFIPFWHSEDAKYETQQDFQWVQAAGITGFPCVIVDRGDGLFMASQGYRAYDDLVAVIQKIIDGVES